MMDINLINTVLLWERRLEIEEERRTNLRPAPGQPAAAQPRRPERSSILARVFRPAMNPAPVFSRPVSEDCPNPRSG